MVSIERLGNTAAEDLEGLGRAADQMQPSRAAREFEKHTAGSMPLHHCRCHRCLLHGPERKACDDMEMRGKRSEDDVSVEGGTLGRLDARAPPDLAPERASRVLLRPKG